MDGRITMATAMGVLGAALLAEAHLVAGSLTVKGGEKFKVGESVSVKWSVSNTHAPGKFDLMISTNGGSSFELIETKTFPLSPGEYTYAWTVPNKPSTTAQFQVCQYDGTVQCNGVYVLKSTNFTIESGSSIRRSESSTESSLHFEPSTRNLEVSFVLEKEEKVSIQAFDAQGKLLAVLLEGTYKAGSHHLSVFSSGLDASGTLLFQLRMGEQLRSFKD